MSNMKKDLALVAMCNQNYTFCLGTVLCNLQSIDFKYDDLHVFYDNIDEDEINNFKKNWNVVFHQYTIQDFYDEFELETIPDFQKQFLKRYSHLAFIKYKALSLLKHYKKVIFTDLDVLFTSADFESLFKLNGIAWRPSLDINHCLSFYQQPDNLPNILEDIKNDFKNDTSKFAPNAGFFYGTDDIDYQNAILEGDKYLKKILFYFTGRLDELVISYISFNIVGEENTHFVSDQEYNIRPFKYSKNTKLVHFFNSPKPWNSELEQLFFPEWKLSYFEYIKYYGGKASKQFTDFTNQGYYLYRQHVFEEYWEKVLNLEHFDVPNFLKFNYKVGFTNPYVIFNYKNNMYFELLTNPYNKALSCGFWFKQPSLIDDAIIDFANILKAADAKLFNYKIDKNGIYIFSESNSIEQTIEYFKFFILTILNEKSPFINF